MSFLFFSDMSALLPHDVVGNCRIAFDAAENLGIPRVIEPRDMSLLTVPDKLAVMTYLYQLRAHFTGHQLEIEQIGNTSDESSYVIGNYKTDNLSSQNILTFDHLKKRLAHQNSLDDVVDRVDEKSPTEKKDVKNLILSGSKHFLGKVLSPAKDRSHVGVTSPKQQNTLNNQITNDKPVLMTRRELTDPFGSDDEDEQQSPNSNNNQPQTNLIDHQRNNNTNKDESLPTPTIDPVKANVSLSCPARNLIINNLFTRFFRNCCHVIKK